MVEKFKEGKYLDGLLFGLDEVGKILSAHFPIRPDDINELPNDVEIS
jgi:uncharacterized membrane protein